MNTLEHKISTSPQRDCAAPETPGAGQSEGGVGLLVEARPVDPMVFNGVKTARTALQAEILHRYLTYSNFAEKVGVRPDQVSNYLRGKMKYVSRVNRSLIFNELVRLGLAKPKVFKVRILPGRKNGCAK